MKKIYSTILLPLIICFLATSLFVFPSNLWSAQKTKNTSRQTLKKKRAVTSKQTTPKKNSSLNTAPQTTVRENVFSEINPDSLNDKAILKARSGDYEEAVAIFEQASRIREEQSALLFNNLGYTYELMGKNSQAIVAYQAAVKRDTNLVLPLQNLGKLLYRQGDFTAAIEAGEKVLQLDPQNEAVEVWLPDAYRKATEAKILNLRQEKANRKGKFASPLRETSDFGNYDDFSNNIRFGFMPAFAQDRNSSKLLFHKQKSIMRLAASFHLNLLLWRKFKIGITVETPYSGALNLPFLAFKQTTQLAYLSPKGFYVGMGIVYLVGNLNDASIPGVNGTFLKNNASAVSDIKFGLLLGYLFNGGEFHVGLYPRYLFADPKSKDTQTTAYDYVDFYLKLKTSLAPKKKDKYAHHVKAIFNMLHREDYISEYNVSGGGNLSHFLGLTSFQLGFEFGNLSRSYNFKASIGFYVGANLYFMNLSNSELLSIGKGQGFFGLDFSGSNKFSGYRTFSEVFAVFSRQEFKRYYFFEQQVSFEVFEAKAPYSFSFSLGLKFGFRF